MSILWRKNSYLHAWMKSQQRETYQLVFWMMHRRMGVECFYGLSISLLAQPVSSIYTHIFTYIRSSGRLYDSSLPPGSRPGVRADHLDKARSSRDSAGQEIINAPYDMMPRRVWDLKSNWLVTYSMLHAKTQATHLR